MTVKIIVINAYRIAAWLFEIMVVRNQEVYGVCPLSGILNN
jgi:hypothetical protein